MKKNTLRITFFLLVSLSVSNVIRAQRDFRPGFIITNDQDTIRGFILNRDANMFQVCRFKKDLDEKVTEYLPSEIFGFRFNEGKYFVSGKVPVYGREKLVFLEYLIKGKLNIYFLNDVADHYYSQKEGGRIVELTEKDTILYKEKDIKYYNNEGTPYYYKKKNHTGKLKAQLSDCMEVMPEVDNTQLNHKSLIKLAKDYHTIICTDEQCIVFEHKSKPTHLNVAIHTGLIINKINFGGFLESDYRTGSMIGCRLELADFLDWSQHTSLMLDIDLQRFTNYTLTTNEYASLIYNGKYISLSTYTGNPSVDVNIKAMFLRIPLTINHIFPLAKINPTLGGGFTNTFTLKQNPELKVAHLYQQYNQSIPFYNLGLHLKAGARYALKGRSFLYAELTGEYIMTKAFVLERFSKTSFSLILGFSF